MRICVWHRLAARLIRLGVLKGVGRRASPYHRKNNAQTLTKLFVFGSESSYNILPTNFDFVCKYYRMYMCTPMSYAGSTPALNTLQKVIH